MLPTMKTGPNEEVAKHQEVKLPTNLDHRVRERRISPTHMSTTETESIGDLAEHEDMQLMREIQIGTHEAQDDVHLMKAALNSGL
eukprot:TRINITY_DN3190_c0_g1_i1.p1 TRINITY_DN3190_c0_g1~~TRINITY_DN3190_c0_g1_i1.p1  ORF type:complete len:85 (-),score=8.02 TRINITY_DN3190_c0_g1_i1:181-435(-)